MANQLDFHTATKLKQQRLEIDRQSNELIDLRVEIEALNAALRLVSGERDGAKAKILELTNQVNNLTQALEEAKAPKKTTARKKD